MKDVQKDIHAVKYVMSLSFLPKSIWPVALIWLEYDEFFWISFDTLAVYSECTILCI